MPPPRKPTGGKRPPGARSSGPKFGGDRPTGDRPARSGGPREASRTGSRSSGQGSDSRPSRRDERSAGWGDRRERSDSDERPPRSDRPARSERPATGARPSYGDRPARGEAPNRAERPARDGAPRPFRNRDAGPDRGERPARADSRSGTRPTGGPGRPARTELPAEQPRIKRAAPPVRQTEVAAQRIAKALARAGVGSRRDIERMIAEGRIAIDGEVLMSPALNITNLANVTVDGEPVAGIAPAKLYRFHKPAGFLTAARDPAGRPTIMDILPEGLPRVFPVGRLDMNTEGLLLLTTDGELKRALELPSSGVPRVYRVRAFGEVTQAALESLADGATIDGVHYGPIIADIERKTGHNLWLIVTIREGKNREVRRVLENIGLQVNRLIRVAYGPIGLDDLPPRMADEIPDSDVALLKAMLKAAKPEKR